MINKKILVLFIGILTCSNIFSQAGSFTNINLDSRSIAMGNTYVANANKNSVFSNLAATGLTEKKSGINLSYRPWLNNLTSDKNIKSFSGFYSLDSINTIAIGYKHYTPMDEYTVYDNYGNKTGSYSPYEYSIALGYAYNLSLKTALSLSAQYINSAYASSMEASTVSFDIGFKSSYKDISYGAMVRNIGPKLKFDNSSVQLPLTFTAGASYKKTFGILNTITCNLDLLEQQLDEDSGFGGNIGVEYDFDKIIDIRAGYIYRDEAIGYNNFSLGAGINFYGASIDFSYLMGDNALKNNYSVSLSWSL